VTYHREDLSGAGPFISARMRKPTPAAARKRRPMPVRRPVTGEEAVEAVNILANLKTPPKPPATTGQAVVRNLVQQATRKAPAEGAKALKAAALTAPAAARAEIAKQLATAPRTKAKALHRAVMHCNIEIFGPDAAASPALSQGLGFIDQLVAMAEEKGPELFAKFGEEAMKAAPGLIDQGMKALTGQGGKKAPAKRAPAKRAPAKNKIRTSPGGRMARVPKKPVFVSQPLMQAAAPAAPAAKAACFPASAKVLTPRGYRSIASLNVGDSVISGKMRVETVTKKLTHSPAEVLCVFIEGRANPLRTTHHHTLLTKRGWLRADQMRVGDELVGPNAGRVARFGVQAAEPVYNLHTTGDHTFVVEGVVAHNFTEFRGLRTMWHNLFVDTAAFAPAAV